MQTYESLKHTTWECKYHVVFIPKCRRKVLYQGIRQELGEVFRSLAARSATRFRNSFVSGYRTAMLSTRFAPLATLTPTKSAICRN